MVKPMRMFDIIKDKRDNKELTKEQIKNILNSFAKNGVIYGAIDDAQIQCKNCGKVTVGSPNTTESTCCK